MISAWSVPAASDRAERSVARIRCFVAGPVIRRPATVLRTAGSSLALAASIRAFSWSIAANAAATWETRSLSSGTSPNAGRKIRRMCDS